MGLEAKKMLSSPKGFFRISQGSSGPIGKSWQREILFPGKARQVEEYFVYFPLGLPPPGSKRSAVQPQTIGSEVP